jgi:cytochrome b561
MAWRNEANAYGSIAKTLHWLAALCVMLAWLLGTFIDDLPKRLEPAILFAHMSLGLSLLALLLVRLGWRLGNPPPGAVPSPLGPWSHHLATSVHWALYWFMLAVPLSGIMLEFGRGQPVPIFGLFEIASPWARNRAFARTLKEVHELLAHTLLIVAALHAFAALAHHYVLKDMTLLRMLPRRRAR